MKFLEPAFSTAPETKVLLLKASPSTIDRLLKQDRRKRDKGWETP